MKFYEQKIKGVWLLEPEPFKDDRGALSRQYCMREFKEHNIETRICQTNLSQNFHKHTLRGFHYQIKPYGEHKTLFCLNGAIYDVVVDLRPESATFLDWISIELSSTNQLGLHLPAGCANAF